MVTNVTRVVNTTLLVAVERQPIRATAVALIMLLPLTIIPAPPPTANPPPTKPMNKSKNYGADASNPLQLCL